MRRLVVGAPDVVAAWGPLGSATVATGIGAAAVTFSTGSVEAVPLPLAG